MNSFVEVNCNSFHFSKALKILKTTVKGKESAYCSEEAFPSSHTADTIPGNLTDLSNITNKDGGIAGKCRVYIIPLKRISSLDVFYFYSFIVPCVNEISHHIYKLCNYPTKTYLII